MGQTPSQALLQACQNGDFSAAQRALAEGASINNAGSENGFDTTPLMLASKHNHPAILQLLFAPRPPPAPPVIDTRNAAGESALFIAARRGHLIPCAILLDHGSDALTPNAKGELAVEAVRGGGHARVARLLEARCCPFFGRVRVWVEGIFSSAWEDRWLAVWRRRPWDNPAVQPGRCHALLYRAEGGAFGARADRVLSRPRLSLARAAACGLLEVDMVTDFYSSHVGSRSGGAQTLRLQFLEPDAYHWLAAVLDDGFATGRGPAFVVDHSGRTVAVRKPPHALAWEAEFSTAALVGPASPAPLYAPHYAPVYPGPPASGGGGGGVGGGGGAPLTAPPPPVAAYPSSPPPHPTSAPPTGRPPVHPPSARTPDTGGAACTPDSGGATQPPVRPAYLTEAMTKMQRQLAEGTLLPPSAPEPPQAFVCSITTDLMLDPVVCEDGSSYSREGITQWLAALAPGKPVRSPLTGEEIGPKLIPNHTLRGQILEWVEEQRKKGGGDAGGGSRRSSDASSV